MKVTAGDIELARKRLAQIAKPTSLVPSTTLDEMLKARVLIKPENLQKTGSFKIRGAFNRIAAMADGQRGRGVIAASAGNHGQALSYAATRAGIKATIVMPRTASISKVDATRGYGQEVVLEGIDYQEARLAARRLCEKSGALFVDAYDDPFVVAGVARVAGPRAARRAGRRAQDRVVLGAINWARPSSARASSWAFAARKRSVAARTASTSSARSITNLVLLCTE